MINNGREFTAKQIQKCNVEKIKTCMKEKILINLLKDNELIANGENPNERYN